MNCNLGFCRQWAMALCVAVVFLNGMAHAQDYGSMSISDVFSIANRRIQGGKPSEALPALIEVLNRTKDLSDDQGRQTAQT